MSNRTLVYSIVGIIVLAIAIVVIGRLVGSSPSQPNTDQTNNSTPTPTAATTPSATTPTPTSNQPTTMPDTNANCVRDFDANKLQTAKVDIANKFVTLDIKNFGLVKVQLYDKDAPKAVENFLRLVNSGFYDCLTFHRVSKGFVIQGGDPKGDGTGGQSAFGSEFADELNANTPSYKAGYLKGVLAMANHGPNTNSSQFFIMLGDVPLQHSYTIFGKVVTGQNIVDKIGQVDIIPNPAFGPTDGTPKTDIVIQKATISDK